MTTARGPAPRVGGLGVVLAALILHACAGSRPTPTVAIAPPPRDHAAPSPGMLSAGPPAPITPIGPPTALAPPQGAALPPPPPPTIGFSKLPGWDQEDHVAALDMFRASCMTNKDPAWHEVCLRARDLGPQDEAIAKAFWETNFRLRPLGPAGDDEGLLTAYFAPEYPARVTRQWPYTAAVRPPPDDLPALDIGVGGVTVPYEDRAAIESRRPAPALAWMKPEDLFFLQIQGSGVLDFPDGKRLRAVYAANNGLPFVGIAAPMRAAGLLADNNTSGDAIRAWLAAHRGSEANAVMHRDPRYIFFSLQPYDGREPRGAAGIALTPGRALAVDPTRHDYGVVYWISGEAPALNGAVPTYRRLAMALDTGSAIKGEVRADLYLGAGEAAGAEAGRVRHQLKLYRLIPLLDPSAYAAIQ